MEHDYQKALTNLGFSPIEVSIIEFVMLRMGVLDVCEHIRPRFIECYELHPDPAINDARWQKSMREMGFRADAIQLAEHAIFGDKPGTS
jgi:hypothetical protein